MSAWRNGGPTVIGAAAGVTLGLLTLLARGGSGSERAALAVLLVAAAVVVAVVGPWRAAERGPRRAALDVLLASASVALPGLALGKAGALLGGALWVALFGLALVGLTLVVGGRLGGPPERPERAGPGPWPERQARGAKAGHTVGQVVATAAGLLLVAWPHVGGGIAAGLGKDARATALEVTLLTPLPVLGGTFAGADVLRSGRLYGEFPLGQSLPFGYASPTLALEVVAAAALLLALLAAGRARAARRPDRARLPAAAPLLALGLLFALPGQAQAQLFPEPSSGDGTPQIGDLSTRVNLGYWPANLTGYLQVDARDGTKGSKFSFDRVLELEDIFVIPTFEVSFAWENGGRIGIQYLEGVWYGEAVNGQPRRYEESVFNAGDFLESRYRYRTIAFMGEVFIPLTFISDALTLRIITTQRYIKQESKVRSVTSRQSERNSIETLVPTLGVGIDLLIWEVISGYADIQYLDFTTSWFGGEDGRWEMHYREWHVGVRLELVEHAHVMLEWYSVETTVEDGRKDKYRQDLSGPRLQVAILF